MDMNYVGPLTCGHFQLILQFNRLQFNRPTQFNGQFKLALFSGQLVVRNLNTQRANLGYM